MAKPHKFWFPVAGEKGDRTLDQQMQGLAFLMGSVRGKSVLDLGCAEGLIALEVFKAGAISVHGVEYRQQAVDMAIKLAGANTLLDFECADANVWRPKRKYDIVLMLAILHKLKDPTTVLADMLLHCLRTAIIRLPRQKRNPMVIDRRSGEHPFDLARIIEVCGFELEHEMSGPFNEWVGYYKRVKDV